MVCIRRLPGLTQITHHSEDDRERGHSWEQLFRRIPHMVEEKTVQDLREPVGILQQEKMRGAGGGWGGGGSNDSNVGGF